MSQHPKLDYERLHGQIGNRQCPKNKLLDWTFDNIGRDPTTIPGGEWPCLGAPRFLVWAVANYDEFLQLWAKTIPTQAQLKTLEERATDDGRATAILDALEMDLASSAQEPAKESGVPAGGSEAGANLKNGP